MQEAAPKAYLAFNLLMIGSGSPILITAVLYHAFLITWGWNANIILTALWQGGPTIIKSKEWGVYRAESYYCTCWFYCFFGHMIPQLTGYQPCYCLFLLPANYQNCVAVRRCLFMKEELTWKNFDIWTNCQHMLNSCFC